jgi:hypothetical protein
MKNKLTKYLGILIIGSNYVYQLVLNYNKTHYLHFNTKNSREYVLKLYYQGNYVKSSPNTKFLGLIIDDSLSWKLT